MFFIPPPFVLKPFYTKRETQFRACDATAAPLDTLSGWNFPHDALKNLYGECTIPDNFVAGSDAQLIINSAIQVINDTGSEKIAVFLQYLYTGRDGVAGETIITPTKTEIVIPNTTPAKTFQVVAMEPISGLQAGDFFTYKLRRDTNDGDDTWDAFLWLSPEVCLQYIADKVGVEV